MLPTNSLHTCEGVPKKQIDKLLFRNFVQDKMSIQPKCSFRMPTLSHVTFISRKTSKIVWETWDLKKNPTFVVDKVKSIYGLSFVDLSDNRQLEMAYELLNSLTFSTT